MEQCDKSGDFQRENRGSLIFCRERLLTIRNLSWPGEDIDITSDSDNDEDEIEIL